MSWGRTRCLAARVVASTDEHRAYGVEPPAAEALRARRTTVLSAPRTCPCDIRGRARRTSVPFMRFWNWCWRAARGVSTQSRRRPFDTAHQFRSSGSRSLRYAMRSSSTAGSGLVGGIGAAMECTSLPDATSAGCSSGVSISPNSRSTMSSTSMKSAPGRSVPRLRPLKLLPTYLNRSGAWNRAPLFPLRGSFEFPRATTATVTDQRTVEDATLVRRSAPHTSARSWLELEERAMPGDRLGEPTCTCTQRMAHCRRIASRSWSTYQNSVATVEKSMSAAATCAVGGNCDKTMLVW